MIPRHHRASWRAVAVVAVLGTLAACSGSDGGTAADTTAGDQVNLHKLLPISRVTASSWEEAWRPEGCLDPRNDTGWSPNLDATGPVHLTATLATPIRSSETPYLTVQLNFGQGKGQVAGVIELQVLTGVDDGTDLPDDIVALLRSFDQPAAVYGPSLSAMVALAAAAPAPA